MNSIDVYSRRFRIATCFSIQCVGTNPLTFHDFGFKSIISRFWLTFIFQLFVYFVSKVFLVFVYQDFMRNIRRGDNNKNYKIIVHEDYIFSKLCMSSIWINKYTIFFIVIKKWIMQQSIDSIHFFRFSSDKIVFCKLNWNLLLCYDKIVALYHKYYCISLTLCYLLEILLLKVIKLDNRIRKVTYRLYVNYDITK